MEIILIKVNHSNFLRLQLDHLLGSMGFSPFETGLRFFMELFFERMSHAKVCQHEAFLWWREKGIVEFNVLMHKF